MRKVKKDTYPPIHMGTSLMLVIFIILCMVIFAVLSLTSAAKDYNYSEKNADRTTAYYNACNQAEALLAEIDQIISTGQDLTDISKDLDQLEYVAMSDEKTAEFYVAIDEDEVLQVLLNIHPTEADTYSIASWKSISTATWIADQTLPVLGSEK